MTVGATTGVTNPTTATDTVSAGRNSLAQNFDMFLTLLTAQMKNQDPLSPLDNNQFTAQLVQMTGVEQQLAANDMLKQLVANTGGNIASAVDLIGKQVRADTADTKLSAGQAQWGYHLDSDVADLKIQVLDANGRVVDVIAPADDQAKAGDHTLTWDGKNLAGATLPDGVYTLALSTTGSDGKTISVGQIYQEGQASAVEQANGQTLVTINGTKVPLAQILSVTPVASSTASTAAAAAAAAVAAANSNSNTSNNADQTPAQTA
jgi:flagellar basal-body rod modification protein FlgD